VVSRVRRELLPGDAVEQRLRLGDERVEPFLFERVDDQQDDVAIALDGKVGIIADGFDAPGTQKDRWHLVVLGYAVAVVIFVEMLLVSVLGLA